MILENTYQMYLAFLDGIKKYGTGAVNPAAFNRIINDWGQELWIKQNLRHGIELTQDMQERLTVLRVITDGEYAFSRRIDLTDAKPLPAISPNSKVIKYKYLSDQYQTMVTPSSNKYFMFPLSKRLLLDVGKETFYPDFMRMLTIAFKIKYVNNVCKFTGVSEWLDANILKTDIKSVIVKNPFRKPTDERLYYSMINNHFVLNTGTESEGHSMRLDYFRYPRKIFFNKTNNGNPLLEQDGIPDYTGSTQGSVVCELPNDIRMEIVDIAVRTFIERVQDPRYQTYINELNIKNNG